MGYSYLLMIFAISGFVVVKLFKYKSLYPFMPFKYNFGKRRVTFAKTLELLGLLNAKVLVETGTSRQGLRGAKGDGASTILFATWAKRNGAFLYSVDIDKESVNGAQNEVDLQNLNQNVRIYCSDSLTFLRDFEKTVDFLYLDSYDYSKDPVVQVKSQEHHLSEFKAIENRLHKGSIVLIDDCRLPNGGKGKLAVEYMLQNDWKILLDKYQILLVRNNAFF